jgi:cellulose synthase operon protein C
MVVITNNRQVRSDSLAAIQADYDQGLYLRAYQTVTQGRSLTQWIATTSDPIAAQVLAGRIAAQVGAPRLGRKLHLQVGRQAAHIPVAAYFYTQALISTQGLLKAWQFAQNWVVPTDITPRAQAEWWALQAHFLGHFRDFDRAEILLQKAQTLDPDHAWLYVEKAWLLEKQDRYEEALEAAKHSLKLQLWHRSGISMLAHLLTLMEQRESAIELLTAADQDLEVASIVWQLAHLQDDVGDYAGAMRSYDRYAELTPLLEKVEQQQLMACRSDAAYALGDYAQTLAWAQQVPTKFYQNVVKSLSQTPLQGQRVVLPVQFLRQHHMTCAPATLAMLSRFWGVEIDHLKLAEEICYDGTSSYDQRRWAEANGWIAREFTMDWATTVQLIDREIPFTLSTVEATSAHLQAVIGYDSYLQQILIRDPYTPSLGTAWAESFLERYAAMGPRGMVLVPRDRADLLNELKLPNAELYDLAYQQEAALANHQRASAAQILQNLTAAAPASYITLHAQRALAAYDGDTTSILEIADRLLQQFPGNENYLQDKLHCLQTLAHREERLELLRSICEQKDSHPVFWQRYATELSDNAQVADEAIYWLRRSIRYMPTTAQNYAVLADILWGQQQFERSLELYRLATCLSDKQPRYARSYFLAARYFDKTDEALELLEQRWQRFGKKSNGPALTLFWAYNHLDRNPEAFALLEQACALRPEDGDLLLAAARSHIEHGQFAKAKERLKTAQGKVAEVDWCSMAAEFAQVQGNQPAAIQYLQQVLQVNPLDTAAHRSLARLLAETQSVAAMLDWLQQACTRFSFSYPLHQLWAEWLENEDVVAAEAVLRRLITIDHSDAWSHRALAKNLSKQRRFDEAFAALETAKTLEPNNQSLYGMWGAIQEQVGAIAAAKENYQRAIQLSVDREWEINAWLNLCQTQKEKLAALDFIYQELIRQVTFGDGLVAYQEAAATVLPPEQLLDRLQDAWYTRSDLWQAWSALIQQLVQLDRLDAALEKAIAFTEAFPLLPKAWLDRASIHKRQNDLPGEAKSLRQALQINPNWDLALYQLSQLYERARKPEQAQKLLQKAIARNPRQETLYGYMADLLSRQDQRLAALDYLEKAIQIDPSYNWAWNRLREWSQELECPERSLNLVRRLTEQRPNEAKSWYYLAATLEELEQFAECLDALDQAIQLNPYYTEAYGIKIRVLVGERRYDEAIEVCRSPVWSAENRPLQLQELAIWVEQEREQHDIALRQLQTLLETYPHSEWGWYQYVKYMRQTEDEDEYLRSAQILIKFDPQDYSYWSYLGEAYQWNDLVSEARSAYERGLAVSAENIFAGMRLLTIQLESGELDAAQVTLDRIKPHLESESYLSRQIKIATLREDASLAQNLLQQLCDCEEMDGDDLVMAIAAMREAGWEQSAMRVLSQTIQQDNPSMAVMEQWIQLATAQGEWEACESRLKNLDVEAGRGAYVAYLTGLGQVGATQQARKFIRSQRQLLQSDTYLWGTVGLMLRTLRRDRELVKWMKGWQKRADVRPWMLVNLAEAKRVTGAPEEPDISVYAIGLEPDHGTSLHYLWLAHDLARPGNYTEAAVDRLMAVENLGDHPEYVFLWHLTRALLVAQSVMGSRRTRRKLINHHVRQAKEAYPEWRCDRPFAATYWWTLQLLAMHARDFHWQMLYFKERWAR